MKRFISVVLISSIILSSAAFAADDTYLTRGEFCDMVVTAADDYNPDVTRADVMQGDGSGNLAEDRQVTKLEAFIMMNRAFGEYPELSGQNLRNAITDVDYKDIPEWAEEDMAPAVEAGIADGSDSETFDADSKVTKADAEKYLKRVYALYGTDLKDDFYSAINKDYLETGEIPNGYAIYGPMYEVDALASEQANDIIRECVSGDPEEGSKEAKIKNYYNNYLAAANSQDISVVQKYIDKADSMSTIDDFKELNEAMYNDLGTSYISFATGIDDMDSTKYIPFYDCSIVPGLQKEAYEGKADYVIDAYIEYLNKILVLSGIDEDSAKKAVNQYIQTEKEISEASLDIADAYDIDKTYNLYTIDELSEIFGEYDISHMYELCGYSSEDKIHVDDVGEMKAVSQLLSNARIDELKNYCKVYIIQFAADFVGGDYLKASEQYTMEVNGISSVKSVEEAAASNTAAVFGYYLSEMYADRYFNEEIKQDVTSIIDDLLDVYREKIDALDWMSSETKERAKRKLDTMIVNVGAPDKYEDIYENVDIKSAADGGSYFQSNVVLRKAANEYGKNLIKEPVDKTAWDVNTFEANAFYYQNYNCITVTAGILQEPVYSINDSYEEKLGKIGFIMAHEISHAFDSTSSRYDENGNVFDWWTAEDRAEFEKLCEKVVKFYDNEEYSPGIPNDGNLTIFENIADMGGISAVTLLGSKTEGFDFKKMYEACACLWAKLTTYEMSVYSSQIDEHSSANVRINKSLQSLDKFYELYDITENDGMYIPESDRASIW